MLIAMALVVTGGIIGMSYASNTGQDPTKVESRFWEGINRALRAGLLDYRFENVSDRKLTGH